MKERDDTTENVSFSLKISVSLWNVRLLHTVHAHSESFVQEPWRGARKTARNLFWPTESKHMNSNKTSLQQGQVRTLLGLRETQDKRITGVPINIYPCGHCWLGGFLAPGSSFAQASILSSLPPHPFSSAHGLAMSTHSQIPLAPFSLRL